MCVKEETYKILAPHWKFFARHLFIPRAACRDVVVKTRRLPFWTSTSLKCITVSVTLSVELHFCPHWSPFGRILEHFWAEFGMRIFRSSAEFFPKFSSGRAPIYAPWPHGAHNEVNSKTLVVALIMHRREGNFRTVVPRNVAKKKTST